MTVTVVGESKKASYAVNALRLGQAAKSGEN